MEWISVNEKLPEKDIYVLGTNKKRVYLWMVNIPDNINKSLIPDSAIIKEKTTHWMPLPPLPKE